jgi:hypothetical protein
MSDMKLVRKMQIESEAQNREKQEYKADKEEWG